MDIKEWFIVYIIIMIIIATIIGSIIGIISLEKKIEIEIFEQKIKAIEQHNLKPELVKILINGETKEE